jgi:adenine phosphoribosyltransferase
MDLKDHIRSIPDFPKPGIVFRDVTTLFGHGPAMTYAVDKLAEAFEPYAPAAIAGVEARGFLLAGALAYRMRIGAVMVRKQGKLPWRTINESYELEYGQAVVELHEDAVSPGDRVAVVDDLIATGGTGAAAISLIRRLGANPVIFGAVIDLPELGGADKIRGTGVPVTALAEFEGH